LELPGAIFMSRNPEYSIISLERIPHEGATVPQGVGKKQGI